MERGKVGGKLGNKRHTCCRRLRIAVYWHCRCSNKLIVLGPIADRNRCSLLGSRGGFRGWGLCGRGSLWLRSLRGIRLR